MPAITKRQIEDWTSGKEMPCLVCGETAPEGDDCPSDHYGLYDCKVNNGQIKTEDDIRNWLKEMREE